MIHDWRPGKKHLLPPTLPQRHDKGFLGADKELPPHVGGLKETEAPWDPTEPLFPHQSLSVTPICLSPTQCPQPAFLLLLQHHKKVVAETLVTFRPQPAACLGLPGSSPTREGVSAQRPCGDMSLGCRSLREWWWALHASAAWERISYAQPPNNQSPRNNHWVLAPWSSARSPHQMPGHGTSQPGPLLGNVCEQRDTLRLSPLPGPQMHPTSSGSRVLFLRDPGCLREL